MLLSLPSIRDCLQWLYLQWLVDLVDGHFGGAVLLLGFLLCGLIFRPRPTRRRTTQTRPPPKPPAAPPATAVADAIVPERALVFVGTGAVGDGGGGPAICGPLAGA
eukprot:SAG11_NODE_5008_length_1692_cov_4.642812_1_plen_105_part_01